MWFKAIACMAATQLCLDFPRGDRERGGDRLAGRLAGCFQPGPDFSFLRTGLGMGTCMCAGWYFKVTAAPHLKESKAFPCE